jgi:hypothetical protein
MEYKYSSYLFNSACTESGVLAEFLKRDMVKAGETEPYKLGTYFRVMLLLNLYIPILPYVVYRCIVINFKWRLHCMSNHITLLFLAELGEELKKAFVAFDERRKPDYLVSVRFRVSRIIADITNVVVTLLQASQDRSGCTATTVLITNTHIICANSG